MATSPLGTDEAASTEDHSMSLSAFEQLAWRRRSSLLIDPERAVDLALVERLCGLVYLAPNHKRTLPWSVAVFTGPARARLGALLADDLVALQPDTPGGKVEKTKTKYGRAPVVVVVGCKRSDDPARQVEDRHAVAAGVENLLLAATAAGLATLWSSPPVIDAASTCHAAGFDHGTELVAVVYLGWPSASPPAADRPRPAIVWHDR